MPENTDTPIFPAAANTVAVAQRNIAAWTRACTELAQGVMAAEIAQMDLARNLFASAPPPLLWPDLLRKPEDKDAAGEWLADSRVRMETALGKYRRIQDDLADTVFRAARTMVDGFGADAGSAPPMNEPIMKPGAAPARVSAKVPA